MSKEVKHNPISRSLAAVLVAVTVPFILMTSATAQSNRGDVTVAGRDVTIVVTAHPHGDETRSRAAKLQPSDFSVREDGRAQRIVSVKRAAEAPPIIAVVIQDDLVSRVNNEIKGIKEFIRTLPEGTRVMTAYITTNSLQVAQDFTTDRERAAESLRILRSSDTSSSFSPYIQVIEALRRFDSQTPGRRLLLLVSDGLDDSRGFSSASPFASIDLGRAIREAQRRAVAVFTFFAPSVGLTGGSRIAINYGQGSLNRLADETGGEAFFSGLDFVSFDPYFKEFNELLGLQWVITYRSSGAGSDFRRIEVTSETDVHLHHPAGYRTKE